MTDTNDRERTLLTVAINEIDFLRKRNERLEALEDRTERLLRLFEGARREGFQHSPDPIYPLRERVHQLEKERELRQAERERNGTATPLADGK